MNEELAYAYIDESGTVSGNVLVICGVVTNDSVSLEKKMKAAERKTAHNKKNEEIKASKQRPVTRRRILTNLIESDFEVYSVVFDLNTIKDKPFDFERIYHIAMGLLCKEIYKDHPKIVFIIDKRYTNEFLRLTLDKCITEVIYESIQNHIKVEIRHEDSISNALLRVADFAAYETYQYFKNQSDIYELLMPRIRKRIISSNTSWNKIKKESKTP